MSDPAAEPELLPCPFCGAAVAMQSSAYQHGFWICHEERECEVELGRETNVDGDTYGHFATAAEAAAAWNRRTK